MQKSQEKDGSGLWSSTQLFRDIGFCKMGNLKMCCIQTFWLKHWITLNWQKVNIQINISAIVC